MAYTVHSQKKIGDRSLRFVTTRNVEYLIETRKAHGITIWKNGQKAFSEDESGKKD